MYKKKLTDEEFYRKVINKELEIANAPITFDEIIETKNQTWFTDYTFNSKEEFLKWKDYFNELFYEWKPKRVSKTERDRTFSMFNLNYGLRSTY